MAHASQTPRPLVLPVQRVRVDEPWEWLSAGWQDFRRAPVVSLTYGAAFVAVSVLLTVGLRTVVRPAVRPAGQPRTFHGER